MEGTVMLYDPMLPVWDNQLLNQEELGLLNVRPWHTNGYKGKGVNVAVLDNRVDTGVEFLKQQVTQPLSHDTGGGEYSIRIKDSHGQRVCETLLNVAPDVNITVLPYYSQGRINTYYTLRSSLEWCLRNDIDIINLSISGSSLFGIRDVCKRLVDKGVSIFCSSGNSGIVSLVDVPDIIPVGWVQPEDGVLVKQGASGDQIYCVTIGRYLFRRILQDGAPRTAGGTSYACPAASGMIALYFQRYKEINGAYPSNNLVRSFINKNCINPDNWELPSEDYGRGFFRLPSPFSIREDNL